MPNRTVSFLAVASLLAPVTGSADVPRTAWGTPSLEGTWDFKTATPYERPEQYKDREFITL